MSDFFKKLNVLVKASLHDLLGDDERERQRPPLRFDQLGKGIDAEIANLRQRINDALNYEDELTARVQTLTGEVSDWDAKADAAVESGQEEQGRYAISQMQLTQQRLQMAEADLRDHQRVTQELILRVNELEAAVADARRAQEAEATPVETTAEDLAESRTVNRMAADVLRDMREKVSEMGDLIRATDEVQSAAAPPDADAPNPDDTQVEDDLSRRRNRLSKK